MAEHPDILAEIERTRSDRGRVVVGVSGFGGSGKSTLVRALIAKLANAVRLRGDDFLNPDRSHQRSANWDGVERLRIRHEVIDPFVRGDDVRYRPFDWSTRALGSPVLLPKAEILIIDAIGLFHPEIRECLDLKIWVDVSLAASQRRGMARDHAVGRSHDELWNEVWVPNDRDFAATFAPASFADLIYTPEDVRDR